MAVAVPGHVYATGHNCATWRAAVRPARLLKDDTGADETSMQTSSYIDIWCWLGPRRDAVQVKAIATTCRSTFLSINGAQLYSPYVGDSERALRDLFTRARAAPPAVIFLDEVRHGVCVISNHNSRLSGGGAGGPPRRRAQHQRRAGARLCGKQNYYG